MNHRLLVGTAALALLFPCTANADQVIVQRASGDIDVVDSAHPARTVEHFQQQGLEAEVDGTTSIESTSASAMSLPNDPFFFNQWQFSTPNGVNIDSTWDVVQGSGVTVGVLDTGVDAAHPDLAGSVVEATSVIDAISAPDDTQGHGTHVSGIITANLNNQVGVVGIAPEASVVSIKVLGGSGSGAVSDLVKGADYAGRRGLRVVNASLSATYSPLLEQTMSNYPNTLFVVSAGNSHVDVTASQSYPCAFTAANILCVGALQSDGNSAPYSNFSVSDVDLFAPGDNIGSTWPGGLYAYQSGTSMAAPMVTGAAALMLQASPNLSTTQLKDLLISTATKSAALTPLAVSGGMLNVQAALTALTGIAPAGPIIVKPPEPIAKDDLTDDTIAVEFKTGKTHCKKDTCKTALVYQSRLAKSLMLQRWKRVACANKNQSRCKYKRMSDIALDVGTFKATVSTSRHGVYRIRVKATNSVEQAYTLPRIIKNR